ncbi:MAG: radical SAM family heme chaperone HemW [Lachnospiraceae bacterium]|nr:radical SAM family heme chaperone HemW [Lachnospiraceae bacterium]
MNHKDRIGLYIHIPFCVRKCDYCDFLSFPAHADVQLSYMDALCKQIDATDDDRSVASVYIGGGTPSVVAPEQIERILCKLNKRFCIEKDAEITIEVNPGTVTGAHFDCYKRAGINRLSIGLQSAWDDELKLLGRIHDYQTFLQTFHAAREHGFDNINIDLMTALPDQTAEKLQHSLSAITALFPEHISAYSLILEEDTPFYERYAKERAGLPDEETERKLYYLTRDFLQENGYKHYEISNFARPGYESRHNSACWRRQDYLGFGLGASSLNHGMRYHNSRDMETYLADPCKMEEMLVLSEKDCMEEFMFLGLRMLDGISVSDFSKTFSEPFDEVFGDAAKRLIDSGLLEREKDRLKLTDQGIDHGNYVFSCFLFP